MSVYIDDDDDDGQMVNVEIWTLLAPKLLRVIVIES